jgi:ribosomal protein L3 glutamine methyltransferase
VSPTAIDTLLTVRDFLRFAVSRMREARVAHGHGASSVIDEAAYLILEALKLPVDNINPWLEAQLLLEERRRLFDLIEARVTTRKPSAYLLGRTYVGGVPFRVDERTIVPRSYLGELLVSGRIAGGEGALIEDAESVGRVLDLCTGSGCLAILAARVFPRARIDALDVSLEALEVARANIDDHELTDRIGLHRGSLFEPIADEKYDLILTNPPYVSDAEMQLLPPEYRHEPAIALAGGGDGLDIVRRILREAPAHLIEGGALVCEIGTGREILESEFPELPFLWLDTEESEGEVFWLVPGRRGARRTRRGSA